MTDDSLFGTEPARLKKLAALGFEELRDADGKTPAPPTAPALFTETLGDWVGPYQLVSLLGEGGMGVVYLAQQTRPVSRQVALKIIKPGMDSQRVMARFAAEQQALALMEHPHIARVYDAGLAPSGRPYFVMEHVPGLPITEYCDQQRLTIEERLHLFLRVCAAVQHAHQKGIIHRDLKPSNILVMVQDQEAVPKIIDFGVARAISQPLTERTLVTEQGQLIGTPEYMSPEQAEAGSQDIDTRTDVYSLGVVLYELLAGVLPFDRETFRQGGLEHVRKILSEEEPKTPSTRLSKTSLAESSAFAQRRRTDARTLQRKLHGDLDWITLKALEKNRTRRYGTAQALAEDIERYLNHQPVSARSPTVRYRTGKYVGRHRRVLATAGAFAVLLVLGTTLSVWEARRAGQMEKERASLRKLPEIEQLLEKDDYPAAFQLVEQVRPFIEDDPGFQALAARVVRVISVETEPPGAQVFLRDYRELNPDWQPIGKSPLREMKVPWGFKRWKITLPGYEVAEGAVAVFTSGMPVELKVKLDRTGTIAPGMVRIPGRKFTPWLWPLDPTQEIALSDYLLDRYEVSNRQFQEFVAAGGYQKPQYWKHRFVKEGVELDWPTAMKMFVDRTGRPGPAPWENGGFPPGQEDYPVGGVSWYEAAAYAEWAGKRLPTVYHWSLAAGDLCFVDGGFLIPLSNFGGKGPAPAGTFPGMTRYGVYDMVGNAKEWCFNEVSEGYRVIAGGGWNEPEYMAGCADKCPPFWREASFGFRCMKPLADDGVWEQAAGPAQYRRQPSLGDQKPCSDEVFQAYRRRYDYNKSDLQPTMEANEVLSVYTRREKVAFNAAYGNERVIAYLFLPRTGKPPFQVVVHWPGGTALVVRSIAGYGTTEIFEKHTRNGRAFVFPVLKGTFERGGYPEKQAWTRVPEDDIMRVKDFERTIDYLQTRPDQFDINKLAYEGISWGAVWGGIVPAIETRIKVAVMLGGGLDLVISPPECSQVNFAPRIKIPILLQNGQYDAFYPVESSQKPFLELFGTAQKDKHHRIYEGLGHSTWLKGKFGKDELDFLDKYLGPVR